MTKLNYTSKTAIVMSFLVMNLERWLKAIFLSFSRLLYGLYNHCFCADIWRPAKKNVTVRKIAIAIHGPFL